MELKKKVNILFQKIKWKIINEDFLSASMSEKEILDTIKEVHS